MKRLFGRGKYSIPVILVSVLLMLALVTGGVLAAYSFLSFTTEIVVDEPLLVEYNLQGQYGGDSLWHPLGDVDSLTIDGCAGDKFDIDLRMNNRANNPLTVNTVMTGDTGYFTLTGFPDGTINNIALSDGNDVNSPEYSTTATVGVNGDAPVGTWSVTFTFERS